jgi:hypothetical protein
MPGMTERLIMRPMMPSKGDHWYDTKSIVTPTSGSYIERIGTNLWHVHDTWSVGFRGYAYLAPKYVSFTNIDMREGACNATATGWLSCYDGDPHPVGSWVDVHDGNSTTGCLVGLDRAKTSVKAPPPDYDEGDFNWPIPWQYRFDVGDPSTTFTTANHHETSDPNGKATIEKQGAGPVWRVPSDPNSDWD